MDEQTAKEKIVELWKLQRNKRKSDVLSFVAMLYNHHTELFNFKVGSFNEKYQTIKEWLQPYTSK